MRCCLHVWASRWLERVSELTNLSVGASRPLISSEMTNSDMTERVGQRKPDKRTRLVEGARLVLHQQGVEKTTLADIAQAADVPVGNVYYYFKTKDELVQAAIDAQAQDIETALASFDRHRSPKPRLKAFVKLLT